MQVSSNKTLVSNNPNLKRQQTSSGKVESQNQKKDPISNNTDHSKEKSRLVSKRSPSTTEINHLLRPDSRENSMTLRRSYGMVVSGFENVAKQQQLTSEAADQFGKTVSSRIKELNKNAIRVIKDLPEYKSFGLDDIKDLGNQISELIQDPEEYLKGFALLKNPDFANLMESTENVHRSFAESMKDNGEEKLLFGMLQMIKDLGGLVGFQESTQINQNNSSVNIRA